jgi:hypothetical protein
MIKFTTPSSASIFANHYLSGTDHTFKAKPALSANVQALDSNYPNHG